MSPTEFDLRAALHDGEGDGVDADRLIAVGQTRRAQRRVRVLSTAAVVVVVAGAGAGGAFLVANNDSNSANSGGRAAQYDAGAQSSAKGAVAGAGGAEAPAASLPSGSASRQTDQAAKSAAAAVPCPNSLPRYLLPGGGSPGQFGSDGPLFSKAVTSVVVCSYGSQRQALGQQPTSDPARLVLTGARATELANSLEHASMTRSNYPCPTIRSADEHELVIIGVGADGATVGTVTTSLTKPACDVQVTNGTAVRYQWQPPADRQPTLLNLQPADGAITKSVPNHSPSGKVHGSPVRS
jgi:hypothetical protein